MTDLSPHISVPSTAGDVDRKRLPARGSGPVRTWVLIGVIVLIVAGGGVVWDKVLKPRFIPRNFMVVEPGQIYRSGQISRHLIRDVLQEYRIGLIVFMSGDNLKRPDVVAEIEAARDMGIKRINCPLGGKGTGDIQEYATAIKALDQSRETQTPVLLHCHAGAQRTGGVIAMYRVLVQRRSVAEAQAELLAGGHDPEDNPELIPYLNEHVAELADLLVQNGTIEQAPATPIIFSE